MTVAAPALRVVVNVVSQTAGGGTTVARHVVRELALLRPDWQLEVHVSDAVKEVDWPSTVRVVRHAGLASAGRRIVWEQLVLPRILNRGGADAYVAMGGFACFFARLPQVCVWQNALIWAPETPGRSASSRLYIRVQRAFLKRSIRIARVNIFPSRIAVDELSDALGHRPPNSVVSYFGPPDVPDSHSAPREAFVLAVGDIYLHKNYKTLIEAFVIYRREFGGLMHLKIAGAPIDRRCQLELESLIRETGSSSFVRMLFVVFEMRIALQLGPFHLGDVDAGQEAEEEQEEGEEHPDGADEEHDLHPAGAVGLPVAGQEHAGEGADDDDELLEDAE